MAFMYALVRSRASSNGTHLGKSAGMFSEIFGYYSEIYCVEWTTPFLSGCKAPELKYPSENNCETITGMLVTPVYSPPKMFAMLSKLSFSIPPPGQGYCSPATVLCHIPAFSRTWGMGYVSGDIHGWAFFLYIYLLRYTYTIATAIKMPHESRWKD